MSSVGQPQLEDGYTRIANELLEALIRYPFSGGELKVVLALIRVTYGWRARERQIKQTELVQLTGLYPRYLQRVLTRLRHHGIFFRQRYVRPHAYRLNKHYRGWREWPTDGPVCSDALRRGPAPASAEPGCKDVPAPAPWSRVRKETKEKDLPDDAESAVENLERLFERALQRPLTPDEQDILTQLDRLSPLEAAQLIDYLAAGRPPQRAEESPHA